MPVRQFTNVQTFTMPLRIPVLRHPARPFILRPIPCSLRPFSVRAPLRLNEDANHTPESAENLKQQQLKEQEQGKGKWHEGLGSASEGQVKADREEVDDHGEHMEELQDQGAKQAEEEKK